jgi:inner membrane protein
VDSITHIVLGAVAGEAIAGKVLGKRALFYGALAQSIPDIDFLAAFWLPAADNLLAHRGFTHSFLFGVLVTTILAIISQRWHRPLKIPLLLWLSLYGVEILIHLLLDACNAYGVGWLEPFSHQRFSFHILFVADPFFSIGSGIALVFIIILDSKSPARRFWIASGLIITSAYFLYAIANKLTILRSTSVALEQQHLSHKRLLITPTPMNTWLWYVVAEADSGFYTTYRSTFDNSKRPLQFTFFAKRDSLLEPLRKQHDVKKLIRFSQDYYTVDQWGDTLVFNDLRFGQIAGWNDPEAKFIFHYYLNYPEANLMVIQRGRFSNWNRKTFRSMVERIRGKSRSTRLPRG